MKFRLNSKLKCLLVLSMVLIVGVISGQPNTGNRFKRVDYDYDLVSGNVKSVHYQAGEADQMHHKYEYDEDNKITNVYTSKDSVIWDQDAKYFYYKHGPLARTELGNEKVQAMDYAYNLQGWIKGVNSNNLKAENDMGQDGQTITTNTNKNVARDAFGYSLNYYNGDYQAIDPSKNLTANSFVGSTTAANYLSTDAPSLFNGNISAMVTTIVDPATNSALPQLTAYKYDQLNRIKQMKAYSDINLPANTWGDGSTYNGSYEEHYVYNANGSIQTLNRNGLSSIAGGDMDDLMYIYETKANGYKRNTNKLLHINDAVATSTYTNDMDDQGAFVMETFTNYHYDEIGNLIEDNFECIQDIEWTVYGKVKKLTRTLGCTTENTAMPDLEFNYDAGGNLTEKIVKPAATLANANTWLHTYYVHDAKGNIMATYEKEGNTFKLVEQQLYGSSHVGTAKRDLDLTVASTEVLSHTLGKKQFFLTDHRGNNNVTLSDRKISVESVITTGTIAYFEPLVDRSVDFYPSGREQNGRIWNRDESEYGYNGKPNIKEWSARLGGAINYGFRIYMPNSATFLSVDPLSKSYPWYTPYQFAGNKPIFAIDLDGLEENAVIRWYDGEKYVGSTIIEVPENKRLEGHEKGTLIVNQDIHNKPTEVSQDKQHYFDNFDPLLFHVEDGTKKLSGGKIVEESKNSWERADIKKLKDNEKRAIAEVHYDEVVLDYVEPSNTTNPCNPEVLKPYANNLKENPEYQLNIEGNASKGDYKNSKTDAANEINNVKLSQGRAKTAKDLILKGGSDESQIKTVGNGSSKATSIGNGTDRNATFTPTIPKDVQYD